jgi:hypothetical protein
MNQPPLTPPSRYLRYLPGVFARADDGFLAHYLLIFEKLLTGLADNTLDGRKGIQELLASSVIGNLFYSRFSFLFPPGDETFIPPISGPPADESTAILERFNSYIGVPPLSGAPGGQFSLSRSSDDALATFTAWLDDFLAWLGGWVNLALDSSWDLDKKRNVIAQSMALYRMRGTSQGLQMLLTLVLDLPLQVSCVKPSDTFDPVYGDVDVTVLNPAPPPILLNDNAKQSGTFVLRCAYQPGMPLVSGYAPWLFLVQVLLPTYADATLVPDAQGVQQIQALLARITTVLDAERPAATRYQLQILGASALSAEQIYQPVLNSNAILGTQI